MYYSKIKTIKKIGKRRTFDLKVEKNHNFLLDNGILSHNSGKTSSNRRSAELKWELKQKLFMIYDAGRMDNAFFMFASDSDFWKLPKIENGKIVSARSYPVKLLYPVTSKIPNKLPYNAVPFTIGVSDLDENDISALVGLNSKDTVKGAMNFMKRKVNDDTTPLDFLNIMGAALRKSEDFDSIKISHFGVKKLKGDVLLPLINEGLLTSKNSDITLNLRDEIKDNRTISVLVLRHCPQNLWGFIVYYFLNHIFQNLAGFGEERRIKQKTTIAMNEVADLLSNDEDVGSSGGSISKMIEKILKQYRTGEIYALMDTQILNELPVVKDTISKIRVFNSGIAEVQSCMEVMGLSSRSGQINQDDLMIIPRLPPGYYYSFDRNSGVSFHKAVWCRSRTWKEGDDFYDVYDKIYGKASYQNILPILKKLEEERKNNEDLWSRVRKQVNAKNGKSEETFDEEIESEEHIEEKIEEKNIQEEIKEEVKIIDTKNIKEVKLEESKIKPPAKKRDYAAFAARMKARL